MRSRDISTWIKCEKCFSFVYQRGARTISHFTNNICYVLHEIFIVFFLFFFFSFEFWSFLTHDTRSRFNESIENKKNFINSNRCIQWNFIQIMINGRVFVCIFSLPLSMFHWNPNCFEIQSLHIYGEMKWFPAQVHTANKII